MPSINLLDSTQAGTAFERDPSVQEVLLPHRPLDENVTVYTVVSHNTVAFCLLVKWLVKLVLWLVRVLLNKVSCSRGGGKTEIHRQSVTMRNHCRQGVSERTAPVTMTAPVPEVTEAGLRPCTCTATLKPETSGTSNAQRQSLMSTHL
jgi:hypothetical protein